MQDVLVTASYLTFRYLGCEIIVFPSRHSYSKEQPLRFDCCSTSNQLLCVMDNEKVFLK